MLRSLALVMTMFALTGCSEIQVISKAMVREVNADAICVERERYQAGPARQPRQAETRTLLAKATPVGEVVGRSGMKSKELWRQ